MRWSQKQRRKSKAAEDIHITVSVNPDWVNRIKVITCLSHLESNYFHWYKGICKLLAFILQIFFWHSLRIKHNSTKLNSEKNTKTRNREKGKFNRTCLQCFFSKLQLLNSTLQVRLFSDLHVFHSWTERGRLAPKCRRLCKATQIWTERKQTALSHHDAVPNCCHLGNNSTADLRDRCQSREPTEEVIHWKNNSLKWYKGFVLESQILTQTCKLHVIVGLSWFQSPLEVKYRYDTKRHHTFCHCLTLSRWIIKMKVLGPAAVSDKTVFGVNTSTWQCLF